VLVFLHKNCIDLVLVCFDLEYAYHPLTFALL
jgi:hypothetical protein